MNINMNREPVAIIEAVKFLISTGLVWAVGMGFWQMTDVQQGLTLTFFLAIVSFLGTMLQRNSVTPSSDPKDLDGVDLVRPDGEIPLGVEQATQAK